MTPPNTKKYVVSKGIAKSRTLKFLDLSDFKSAYIDTMVNGIGSNISLEEIRLNNNPHFNNADAITKALLNNTLLKHLKIKGVSFNKTFMIKLTEALGKNQTLLTLDLKNHFNQKNEYPFDFGMFLKFNTSLKSLTCYFNHSLLEAFEQGLKFNRSL